MDNYFVAKTNKRGFIGLFSLEEIKRKFHTGEMHGNYVATKSVDPSFSYRTLMKSGTATWVTVADLVANLSLPDEATAVASQIESPESFSVASQIESPESFSVAKRKLAMRTLCVALLSFGLAYVAYLGYFPNTVLNPSLALDRLVFLFAGLYYGISFALFAVLLWLLRSPRGVRILVVSLYTGGALVVGGFLIVWTRILMSLGWSEASWELDVLFLISYALNVESAGLPWFVFSVASKELALLSNPGEH